MDSSTHDVPGGKPWISLIWGGVFLQLIGGLMVGLSLHGATTADAEGNTSHGSVATLVIGSILGWVGVVLLLVGIVAVGAYLGTRHLSDRLPDVTTAAAAGSSGPDPTMVSVHEGDSAIVAQIRAMFRHGAPFALKATTASARRIADRAERKGQLSQQDRATIDALIAEAERPGKQPG
jgi:biopolymer transport protein ExbD